MVAISKNNNLMNHHSDTELIRVVYDFLPGSGSRVGVLRVDSKSIEYLPNAM